MRKSRKFFMDPFRRIAFEKLRDLEGSYGWRCHHKCVDVVFHASHLQRRHPVCASNPSDEFPYSLFNTLQKPGLTVLCGKDNVIVKAGVGVRHNERLIEIIPPPPRSGSVK